MFGFLNINKPAGITSRAVVDLVSSAVRSKQVGHAGTLDPLATGVLMLGLGPATRLTDHLHSFSKSYQGSFRLGLKSTTEDTEGEITTLHDAPPVSREQIQDALPGLTGEVMQRPPAVSALRVAGKRAYALARAGKKVELKPRPVSIHSIELTRFDYPDFELSVVCGSGTYLRALGRDVGERVGSCAVMTGLERTVIGPFTVEDAIDVAQFEVAGFDRSQLKLINPLDSFADAVRVPVDAERVAGMTNGKLVRFPEGVSADDPANAQRTFVAVHSVPGEADKLIAVLSPHMGFLKPGINFAHYHA